MEIRTWFGIALRSAEIALLDTRTQKFSFAIFALALLAFPCFDAPFLLDVREKWEFDTARIPGATLIPLGELAQRIAELPQGPGAPDIVVSCKSGARSAKGVGILKDNGFTRVKNLKGGILAWIDKIDPSLSKY